MIIKQTGASKKVKATLQYIEPNKNKAHKNNNGVKQRNLIKVGIGCRTDTWQHTLADFKAYSKPHRKIQSYDFVLSPRKTDFNPDNKEDVYRFTKYATDFAEKAFPHHQVLIAPQDDNTNKNLHAHLIVSNFDVRNGKSLNGSLRNFRRLRYINDKMVKSYNKKYPHNQIYDFNLHKNRPTTRQDKIITIFHNGLTDPKVRNISNLRNYIKNNSNGMTMHTINMGKSTNKYKNHRGIVFKIQNGKRYKNPKHNKYNNKNTYIKFSSLARLYKHKYNLKHFISYRSVKNYLKQKRAVPYHITPTTKIAYIITKHYPKNSREYGQQQYTLSELNKPPFASLEKGNIKDDKDLGIKLVTSHTLANEINHNISESKAKAKKLVAHNKVMKVTQKLIKQEQPLIHGIVTTSVKSNKFKFPNNDEMVPQLVKVMPNKKKDKDKDIDNDIKTLKASAYNKYVNHQGHWLSQQEQLAGHHFMTKYHYLNSSYIKVPERVMPTRIKVPTFNPFKCLGGFTIPQVLYSSSKGDKEQYDIAQNAFKQEDEETQNAIKDGATEVEQADEEDVYEEERANAEDIRRLQHERSDGGPTMTPS